MTNSETKEPKAKVNTRVWACKVNVNQKRPWQIIEVECWVLRPFSLKFRKGSTFWDGKTSSWGRFLFTPKEKRPPCLLHLCSGLCQVIKSLLWPWLNSGLRTYKPITPCNTHFECTFGILHKFVLHAKSAFLAVNFYGFEVLNCAAPSFRPELSRASSAVSTFTFVHVLLDRPEIHASCCKDTQVPKTSKPTKQKTLRIPRF